MSDFDTTKKGTRLLDFIFFALLNYGLYFLSRIRAFDMFLSQFSSVLFHIILMEIFQFVGF